MLEAANDREVRFFSHVEEVGGHWIWQGAGNTVIQYGEEQKYGRFGAHLAHRWSYENWVGQIPAGLDVHHKCFIPACVKPDHLLACTRLENLRASEARRQAALKTHCKYGHELTEDNIYMIGPEKQWRACRTCRNAHRQGKDPATYVRHNIGHNQWR